ncbi:lymphocyte antigen 6B [Labeo rohita]|uniref:lymphocyte antigen 6B n=1 Tax=Labeo rohita TaxID=84645 RepID=UPI0021E33C5B|nr:lymphocyte antigen 6B [Labeo rohita]
MMDLRISVVVLVIFLTGGYSLKCYKCEPDAKGVCETKEETCGSGFTECAIYTTEVTIDSTKKTVQAKGCDKKCTPGTAEGIVTHCCKTDLCNAAGQTGETKKAR